MCGLVGVISAGTLAYDERDFFKDALLADVVRGKHSTGIIQVSPALQGEGYKRALGAQEFLELNTAQRMINANSLALLGHNRAATKGAVSHANAHPFIKGHIALMHNGTLNSHHNLKDSHKFTVDSEAVAYNMQQEGPDETVKKLNGAFGLVWYDQQECTVNFVRNHERTLFLAKDSTNQTVYYASEEGLLRWVAERNRLYFKEVWHLPTYQLYSFDLSAKTLRPEIRDMERYKGISYHGGGYHGTGGGGYGQANTTTGGKGGKKSQTTTTPTGGSSVSDKFPAKQYKGGNTGKGKNRKKVLSLDKDEQALLEKLGVEKGQHIQFEPFNVEPMSGNSKFYSYVGMTLDDIIVRVPGVLSGDYDLNVAYEGVVTGLANVKDGICGVEVLVSATSVRQLEAPTDESKKEGTTEKKSIFEYVIGPQGTHIPRHEWERLASTGCCMCGDPLLVEQAEEIVWDNNGNGYCPYCVEKMANLNDWGQQLQ